jgi:hypothetical protein
LVDGASIEIYEIRIYKQEILWSRVAGRYVLKIMLCDSYLSKFFWLGGFSSGSSLKQSCGWRWVSAGMPRLGPKLSPFSDVFLL